VSKQDGKSTDRTLAMPENAPLIPERQIINHACVITGFSNPHENSAELSVHKVIPSKEKQTNRRARRAGYPFAYTKESDDKPQNVNARKKLRRSYQSWSDKGRVNTYKRFAPMCLWRTTLCSELNDV